MKYENLSEESKYFLNVIESQVSSDFDIDITHHVKKANHDLPRHPH